MINTIHNKVNRFLGLELKFHWTVLILMALVTSAINRTTIATFPDTNIVLSYAIGLFISICVILSITAHEMGHVIAGRRYGAQCDGITIFALGGIAKIRSQLPSAKSELVVALAGPAVSLSIAVLGMAVNIMISAANTNLVSLVIAIIITLNLMFAIFNLIPAFPLDGGRVLRSIIWMIKGDLLVATKYASYGGYIFGSAMIGAGLLMIFGVYIPFLGQGFISGVWIGLIGFIIIVIGRSELQNTLMSAKY